MNVLILWFFPHYFDMMHLIVHWNIPWIANHNQDRGERRDQMPMERLIDGVGGMTAGTASIMSRSNDCADWNATAARSDSRPRCQGIPGSAVIVSSLCSQRCHTYVCRMPSLQMHSFLLLSSPLIFLHQLLSALPFFLCMEILFVLPCFAQLKLKQKKLKKKKNDLIKPLMYFFKKSAKA